LVFARFDKFMDKMKKLRVNSSFYFKFFNPDVQYKFLKE